MPSVYVVAARSRSPPPRPPYSSGTTRPSRPASPSSLRWPSGSAPISSADLGRGGDRRQHGLDALRARALGVGEVREEVLRRQAGVLLAVILRLLLGLVAAGAAARSGAPPEAGVVRVSRRASARRSATRPGDLGGVGRGVDVELAEQADQVLGRDEPSRPASVVLKWCTPLLSAVSALTRPSRSRSPSRARSGTGRASPTASWRTARTCSGVAAAAAVGHADLEHPSGGERHHGGEHGVGALGRRRRRGR